MARKNLIKDGLPVKQGQRGPDLKITQDLLDDVVDHVLSGLNIGEIALKLERGHDTVKKIMKHQDFEVTLRTKFREKVAMKLASKMVQVLGNQLEKDNLQAVQLGLKVLSLDTTPENANQQNAAITVVMPGADKKVKDVTQD